MIRSFIRLTVLALGAATLSLPAAAQSVAVFVNGEAVTTYDVQQRVLMSQRLDRKPISTQQALDEVVNDKLKIQEARRIGYRISDDDVENQFKKYAQNIRQTQKQFEENLRRAGINPDSLRQRTRADISWATIIQQRLKLGVSITNAEVDAAAQEAAAKSGGKSTEYSIQQVVFVVPTGSNAAAIQRRQHQAAAAKPLFKGCGEGAFKAFETIPDVAIKDPVNRSSDTLGEAANALLSKTPVGSLAGPLTTEQGIELIAVCGKKERTNLADIRSAVETELVAKKSAAESERYLKELREKAAIERKLH